MISHQLHFSAFIDDSHKHIAVQKALLLELLEQYINVHELIPIIGILTTTNISVSPTITPLFQSFLLYSCKNYYLYQPFTL